MPSSGMYGCYGSLMAGLLLPTSTCASWRAWLQGSHDASGLVPTAPVNLHVPCLSGGVFGVSLRCSALSRVRVRGSCWICFSGGGS